MEPNLYSGYHDIKLHADRQKLSYFVLYLFLFQMFGGGQYYWVYKMERNELQV